MDVSRKWTIHKKTKSVSIITGLARGGAETMPFSLPTMIKKIIVWFGTLERPHNCRIWLLFFTYPLLVGLFIQLVMLVYIFPEWNAGSGILKGQDPYSFHLLAEDLASQLKTVGWSAWVLRPNGQAPAGIAAIVYALTVPEPWTMLPMLAALHASGTFLLFKLLQRFVADWRIAFLAALPFWLYPSAMTWYTQNHKDGWFICGSLLFLYGWMHFLPDKKGWRSMGQSLLAASIGWFGAALVWIVRPYGVEMLQGVGVVLWAAVSMLQINRGLNAGFWATRIATMVFALLFVACMSPLTRNSGVLGSTLDSEWPDSYSIPTDTSFVAANCTLVNNALVVDWQSTGWPAPIEAKAASLAQTREGYRCKYPLAGSNIDVDVAFHSVGDILAYVPRATQIVFLAPFPTDWFGSGSLPANTFMRRISAVEMIGVYLGLALLPFAIWRQRRKPDTWLVLIFCYGMMLIYSLVAANVGTLYRFRYGFIMTLVSLGLSAGIEFLAKRVSKVARGDTV